MDNRRAIFVFFLSCSPSTVCLYTAQVFIHMLHRFSSVFGEFQAPPIGLEHKLQRFKSFPVDPFGHKYSWNDAEEDGEKRIVLVRVDMAPDTFLAASCCSTSFSNTIKSHCSVRHTNYSHYTWAQT